MVDVVRRAMQLNQDGASKWAEGNLNEALDLFNAALRTMISFEPSATNTPFMTSETADPHSLAAMGIVQVPLSSDDVNIRKPPSHEPFAYTRPFVFNPSLLPKTRNGVAVFSAVQVFNMAVVFHLKTQQEGTSFFAKALHLYECSIDLFSKVTAQYDLSGAIALALNNKASLFYVADDYTSSERELSRLPAYMSQAEHSRSTWAIMASQDFQEVLLNLLTMRKPKMAQAA